MTTQTELHPFPWLLAIFLCVGVGLLLLGAEFAGLARGDVGSTLLGEAVPAGKWLTILVGAAHLAAGLGLWYQQRWVTWLAGVFALTFLATLVTWFVYAPLKGAPAAEVRPILLGQSGMWIAIFSMARRI